MRIEIEDNGIGMSPAQLRKAFTPFYSNKGERGFGLGLYITKEIIERRGGKITAKSQPLKGTRFEIELLAADLGRPGGGTGRCDR